MRYLIECIHYSELHILCHSGSKLVNKIMDRLYVYQNLYQNLKSMLAKAQKFSNLHDVKHSICQCIKSCIDHVRSGSFLDAFGEALCIILSQH